MNAAEKRLEQTIQLLESIPIQSAASAEEPWAKIHLIDVTMAIKVARGLSSPDEWVSEFCGKTYGHSPHHWSEYREHQVPLRVPHWCDGEVSA